MFKLVKRATRWRAVKFEVLGDMGDLEPVEFEIETRISTVEEGRESLRQIKEGELSDKDFLVRWVNDWRNLFDGEGAPLPYSAENLDTLMSYHEALRAMVDVVVEDVTRHDLLKRKNL